ncbi:MAG: hypothetical protein HOD16_03230 [Nitrospina sp.]|nr:hypothetical protein [Nitrospina sp.]
MVFNLNFLKVVVVFIFFSQSVFGVAEGAGSKKSKVKITLRSQFHENSNLTHLKLNHPIKISQAEIINHMVSLRFKGTFLGNKEEPVFAVSEIQTLAPILFKAFGRVDPEKVIRIQLKSVGGITSGDIFSFKKYLNWRFDSIRGETFLQKNNVRGWNIFSWEMMPKKGQRYFKSGADKRIQKNWIISKLKLPISDRENMDNQRSIDTLQKEPSGNNINPKLEEKLEHLKYLYDKQLINEEEYKNQQKKIFDELF